MIATNHDGSGYFTLSHHVVEFLASLIALAVAKPTDTCRQALECDSFLRHGDPATKVLIVREEIKNCFIGCVDVFFFTRERHPTEGAFAFTEQWANIGGNKSGESKCAIESTLARFVADRVAVIEYFRTTVHKTHHGFNVLSHGLLRTFGEFLGLFVGVITGVG